ncbi:MAG: hypothetical protein JST11_17190 [Acidobacteria bacterium]|nr:hypothetical protein [Acidobacteriota bacterium]
MIAAAVFLVVVATAHHHLPLLACGWLGLLLWVTLAARLPLGGILSRGAVVLPFSAVFALLSWMEGAPGIAVALILKSYLSALAVLLLVATTPLPELVRSLEAARVPRFLLTVVQFLYRYIFVVVEEAAHMRTAAAARGGLTFRAAADALAVLFARSFARAEAIHRAMIARGFDGHFRPLARRRFAPPDAVFLVLASALPLLVRTVGEVLL